MLALLALLVQIVGSTNGIRDTSLSLPTSRLALFSQAHNSPQGLSRRSAHLSRRSLTQTDAAPQRVRDPTGFPFSAVGALYVRYQDGNTAQCSASLIAANTILTAGHCGWNPDTGSSPLLCQPLCCCCLCTCAMRVPVFLSQPPTTCRMLLDTCKHDRVCAGQRQVLPSLEPFSASSLAIWNWHSHQHPLL